MAVKKLRIGSGAGFGGDRLDPALTLMERGNLDYIVFECLAERTIALAQREKQGNPGKGFNPLFEYRMEKVLPLAFQKGIKVLTNMGAANPLGALDKLATIAGKTHTKGMRVAAVEGDDVLDLVLGRPGLTLIETGQPLASLGANIISANAYLGAEPIVEALHHGSAIVITGRVADPSLFLAPMIAEFGWGLEDWDKLGTGTLYGHLLECAGQVSGGYFADPGRKQVPDLWNLGFPFAEIDENGAGYISKVEGTGGLITTATCTEQLLYEIHDPASYLTPDCVADFSRVRFQEVGANRVKITDSAGRSATDFYKVSVGYRNGYFGEGEISYGGENCVARARLACEILRKRCEGMGFKDAKFQLIGIDSLSPFTREAERIPEVRIRAAVRAGTLEEAKQIGKEVEALYTNGPAGGGGVTQKTEEVISIASVLLPKSEVKTTISYLDL